METALVLLAGACAVASDRSSDSARTTSSSVVRADDTFHTAEGNVGGCRETVSVWCFLDTAYAYTDLDNPQGYPMSSWILFTASGDSIELSVPPGSVIATNLGQERDSLGNTAPYFRRRIDRNGILHATIELGQHSSDTVPYTLRVAQYGTRPGALRATGETARLNLTAKEALARFSVVPAAIPLPPNDVAPWSVPLGSHKVALIVDSIFLLCRIPCAKPDTVILQRSRSAANKGSGR